jgi:glycerol-3-phosphate acyltransferase PlsY
VQWAGLILGSYLIGAIPFSYLVVRFTKGRDIRSVGSGNAGATNTLRAAGPLAGLSVLALDITKGAVPVFAAFHFGAPPAVMAAVAVAAVLGHCYPAYIGFRGGKGVATALGAAGALVLLPALVATAVLLGVVLWKRYVSLGSIVGLSALPVLVLLPVGAQLDSPLREWSALAVAAIALVVVLRHRDNIKRLRTGRERRLGETVEIS